MKIELYEILVFAANPIQHQYHLSIINTIYKVLNTCKLCGISGKLSEQECWKQILASVVDTKSLH
eukprot:UN13419